MAVKDPSDLVVVGKITTVYGIKGWVKVHSYTEPMENIFSYTQCYINRQGGWEPITFDGGKRHGKGLITALKGIDNREAAMAFTRSEIAVPAASLPSLAENEYYWHQLEGLRVVVSNPLPDAGDSSESRVLLGTVSHLLETGANDVLVVKPCIGSLDQRERLIPYLPEQFIQRIDVQGGEMWVDWDPEF